MAPSSARAVQPRVRARRVRRGDGRRHARAPQPRHRRQGHHGAAEPRAPRRPGRRAEHRRRCGHPAAGARRVLPGRASTSSCPSRAATPPASPSCRSRPRTPPRRASRSRRSPRPRACRFSAGATCRPTTRRSARWPATRCRPSARCSSAARPAWTWSGAPTSCASAPSTNSAPRDRARTARAAKPSTSQAFPVRPSSTRAC